MKDNIKSELQRTGYDLRMLRARDDLPDGLTVRVVRRWMLGTTKIASKQQYEFIVAMLGSMPSFESLSSFDAYKVRPKWRARWTEEDRLEYTSDMAKTFAAELKRTGATIPQIARAAELSVAGITEHILFLWRRRRVVSVDPDYWNFVIKFLSGLPDKTLVRKSSPSSQSANKRTNYRAIGDDEFFELRRHSERTGLSGMKLMARAKDPPRNLNGSIVSAWLTQQTRSADPEHIAYVIDLYRSLPDAS